MLCKTKAPKGIKLAKTTPIVSRKRHRDEGEADVEVEAPERKRRSPSPSPEPSPEPEPKPKPVRRPRAPKLVPPSDRMTRARARHLGAEEAREAEFAREAELAREGELTRGLEESARQAEPITPIIEKTSFDPTSVIGSPPEIGLPDDDVWEEDSLMEDSDDDPVDDAEVVDESGSGDDIKSGPQDEIDFDQYFAPRVSVYCWKCFWEDCKAYFEARHREYQQDPDYSIRNIARALNTAFPRLIEDNLSPFDWRKTLRDSLADMMGEMFANQVLKLALERWEETYRYDRQCEKNKSSPARGFPAHPPGRCSRCEQNYRPLDEKARGYSRADWFVSDLFDPKGVVEELGISFTIGRDPFILFHGVDPDADLPEVPAAENGHAVDELEGKRAGRKAPGSRPRPTIC